jgi:hypothetical protein
MGTGTRKDEDEKAEDVLLTSEDLFGGMVDAPPEQAAGRGVPRAQRIRVQVAEPGSQSGPTKGPAAARSDLSSEDVSSLLDALDEAGPPPLVSEDTGKTELPEDLQEPLDRLMTPMAEPAPLPPPSKAAAPPRPTELLLELAELEAIVRGRPAAATGSSKIARVQVAAPDAGPVGERVALDLAGLAEDAFSKPLPREISRPEPVPDGRSYGPYRLLEKIAVGGMAEVFRAKRTGVEGFEKVVAVKRILPHLSDNAEFVDMFIAEAKMVAGLTHPNIVQIFDLGRIDQTYFIAMEYVHGRDLRSIMKRAKDRGMRVPLDLAAHVTSRVCAAVEYAHRKKDEQGRPMCIVHRDISPQNILISFEGEVKITDFGIAKAATKASDTERGALRGKLLYMSPEQAWGRPVDRRSDLFSLGVVFYEMITDERPFLAASEVSILEAVRQCKIAPPGQLNPRVPERLGRVAMKALAKEPQERYQDASEMARELERALPGRRAPTATELARFMEVLFDPAERGELSAPGHAGEHRLAEPDELEVDLEHGPGAARKRARAEPVADGSVDGLLKKFGIK